MAKVALITDQHFGARSDSIAFIDFYEKFYRDTFFPVLDKEEVKTVLILGDTFDHRKYVNFYSLKRAKEMFFDELQKRNINVHMLAGNHDVAFKNTNEVNSPSLLLSEYHNINVIDSPQTIHLDYGNESCEVCMMPWICSDNYERSMAELKNTSATLCMGHFEIEGFIMHRGSISEGGLSRELFRKFDMVFSGHYHHRSSQDNITYLGNPYELTWQDYADARGFHIFDLSTRHLEFVQNPNVMFHRLTYDDKLSSISEVLNQDLSKYTNTYVKVVVINKTNPYLFDQFMNKLYAVNPVDVNIVEDFTELTELEDEHIDQADDTITTIYKFVDSVQDENIDTSKLKSLIQEIYVEAINQDQS
jgi:DNA repair exonuclease SbcCD nuclease subunit